MGDIYSGEDKDAALEGNCEIKFGSLKLGTRQLGSELSCCQSRRKKPRPKRRKRRALGHNFTAS